MSVSTRTVSLLHVVLDLEIPTLPLPSSTPDNTPNFYEEVEQSFVLIIPEDDFIILQSSNSLAKIVFNFLEVFLKGYEVEIFIPPQIA